MLIVCSARHRSVRLSRILLSISMASVVSPRRLSSENGQRESVRKNGMTGFPGMFFSIPMNPLPIPCRFQGLSGNWGDGELQNEDLAFANMLYDHDGVMGTIQLVEEGQYCTVSDPLWQKMEGKVIKIDRGRKRCCVEFIFDDARRTVWLGYELVNPINDKTEEI